MWMFENSSHGHCGLSVPKTRWGLLLEKVYTFMEASVTPRSILKANHLYMVFTNGVIFAYSGPNNICIQSYYTLKFGWWKSSRDLVYFPSCKVGKLRPRKVRCPNLSAFEWLAYAHSEIQLLLSSFQVSFIPLGCFYFFSYFSSFWYIHTGLLFEHRRNRKWAMEVVQKSPCGVYWLESQLQQTYSPFWDLKISCLSQLAYSESRESARKLMVPTWLRCPRELGYFYILQGSNLRYTNTTPACQLGFCFVFWWWSLLIHLKSKLTPKQVRAWFFKWVLKPTGIS